MTPMVLCGKSFPFSLTPNIWNTVTQTRTVPSNSPCFNGWTGAFFSELLGEYVIYDNYMVSINDPDYPQHIYSNCIWGYNPVTNVWRIISLSPDHYGDVWGGTFPYWKHPYNCLVTDQLTAKAYQAGGAGSTSPEEHALWELDLSADPATWLHRISVIDSSWNSNTYEATFVFDVHNQRIISDLGNNYKGDYTLSRLPLSTMTWTHDLVTHADMIDQMDLGAMVYCNQTKEILRFGGRLTSGQDGHNDTWLMDVETDTWTKLNPSPSPPIRYSAGLAYSPIVNKVLLYGGVHRVGGSDVNLTDTWLFDLDSRTWTEISGAGYASEGRGYCNNLAYDSIHNVFMFAPYGQVGKMYLMRLE